MNVAVLSLTRDRLEYTQHCFAKLREHAGIGFDHLVYDQGSTDGTPEWLEEYDPDYLFLSPDNVGINRAMNHLVAAAVHTDDYDVIVKVDNDCELTQPDTLGDIADLVMEDGNAFLSPVILGLNNPPRPTSTFQIGGDDILNIPQIGGIFLAAPGWVYDEYRYPEDGPVWGMDDADICRWFRGRGGRCGYVARLTANHHETTSGQHSRYPAYFARTLAEGKPSL